MLKITGSAIIFDLDGVLVDSTDCVESHWRRWAAEHGLSGDEVMEIAHGMRTVEVIESVAPNLDAEEQAALLTAEEANDTEGVLEIEGARGLVQSLPEGTWAVATSGTRAIAVARLECTGMPIPAILITADDVENGKPAPDPYLLAAERLGVEPEGCIVVEDTPAGIQAALAAGMRVIAVPTSHDVDDLIEADIVAARLSALQLETNSRPDASRVTVSVEPYG